jgi:hypothetical protein
MNRVYRVDKRGDMVLVKHTPVWAPADLRYNAAGDTRPGFVCVHELENGNGPCGGNVFSLDQAIGTHACGTRYSRGWYARKRKMHAEYHRRHK